VPPANTGPGTTRAGDDQRQQCDHERDRPVQPPLGLAPAPGEGGQRLGQEDSGNRPRQEPDHAVGHKRLLPQADACENDEHRGDEQHDHHDGHNPDARRRRLMEPPGSPKGPVDMRADGTSQKADYQEQRGNADAARAFLTLAVISYLLLLFDHRRLHASLTR
jgi:hypothetical protein